MILYRIVRKKYAFDLNGRGGLLSSARWHDHMPIIYTSLQSSACILEKLVHLNKEDIHHDLQMTVLWVPDEASRLELDVNDLPVDWNTYPGPTILQRIGNAWLASGKSLLLEVPCALDSYTNNVLINPLHPQARDLRVEDTAPFRFDSRLM